MTASQELRRERRRQRARQERREAAEALTALLLVVIWVLIAFNVLRFVQCGTTDADLEAAQISRWEELSGTTYERW